MVDKKDEKPTKEAMTDACPICNSTGRLTCQHCVKCGGRFSHDGLAFGASLPDTCWSCYPPEYRVMDRTGCTLAEAMTYCQLPEDIEPQERLRIAMGMPARAAGMKIDAARTEYAIHWFNQRAFTDNARIQILIKMLEAAGFPSPSPQFDDLERMAIGMLQEREREVYLSHLRAQSEFKRMQMQIGMGIEGDSAIPTATAATIEEENKDPV